MKLAMPFVLALTLVACASRPVEHAHGARPDHPAHLVHHEEDATAPRLPSLERDRRCRPPVDPAGPCLSGGDEITIQNALNGPGAVALLCPNAIFQLRGTVSFTAPRQRIVTQGRPTDASRALLRIASAFDRSNAPLFTAINGAVNGANQPCVELRNIQIDGARAAFGVLDPNDLSRVGAELVMLGATTDQLVDRSRIFDPRGWSALHFFDIVNCDGGQVTNCDIGPSGSDAQMQWADGISYQCKNGLVARNTVTDATDGAIVIFGSTGSTIQNNNIVQRTRTLLGGINLVDPICTSPTTCSNGDYTGTLVDSNTISGQGGFIKTAIAMGPPIWGCGWRGLTNSGATVTNNVLQGTMGYGFLINGVRGFTVTGNVSNATHIGVPEGGCGGVGASAPGAFLYDTATSTGTFQSEFRRGAIDSVLPMCPGTRQQCAR